MISCTEFIPAYSELFKFLDRKSGRQAVYDYWNWRFQPEHSHLYQYLIKNGFRGAWDYWTVITKEEACDCTRIFNEEEGWSISCMHACPSKGRFNKLPHMEPFDEYCKHCSYYNIALEKKGFTKIVDFRGTENACCRSVLVDKARFKGDIQEMLDKMHQCEMNGCTARTTGCIFASAKTQEMNTSPDDLKYLHPAFHLAMDAAAGYILDHYGEEGLKEYLTQYTLAYHIPLLEEIRQQGLTAVEEYIQGIYDFEEAADAISMVRTEKELCVTVHYCPAVKFMKEVRNHTPHKAYEHCTDMVYEALAKAGGLGFEMISYDQETGAAKFRFFVK